MENATPFRSLAALRSGELLLHTSYPNGATLGYSGILADLRERSGVPFRSYQMNFRQSARAARLKDRERVLIQELVAKMPGEGAALETMLAAGNKGDFEQEA